MNRYDEFFDFRIAEWADIDAIMHFIKTQWDSKHILANDRAFFEYHYGNSSNGINVFLMIEKDGTLAGMLGFVQYSNDDSPYISGSVTKVKERLPLPMCGIELMKRFYAYKKKFIEYGCGVNPKTLLPVFSKVFKYYTGEMSQYYFLNRNKRSFQIITVPCRQRKKLQSIKRENLQLVKVKAIDELKFDFGLKFTNLPYKDKDYISKRYFRHPVFNYNIYSVMNQSASQGVLFTRKISYGQSALILVVDFIGDINVLGKISAALQGILQEEDAECVSLLAAGIPENILLEGGFEKIDKEKTDTIIPTYFEPFVNCNITNYYATQKKDLIIFKATGDQDNPKYLH